MDEPERRKASGRRWTITVAGTLLWIVVGNAVLHLDVTVVYVIAVLLAVVLWFVFAPR